MEGIVSTHATIVSTPGVLSGKPRLEGTRIEVRLLGDLIRRDGRSIAEITSEEWYPFLSRQQVEVALDYYDTHSEEVETLREDENVRIQELREHSRAAGSDAES
jgi:uncharacterized protein (DUF433 family)